MLVLENLPNELLQLILKQLPRGAALVARRVNWRFKDSVDEILSERKLPASYFLSSASLLLWALGDLEGGAPFTSDWCALVAEKGSLELLQLLHRRTSTPHWDSRTTTGALKGGNLDTFFWALEKGCRMKLTEASFAAARRGLLPFFEFLQRTGFLPHRRVLFKAMKYGHTELVKFFFKCDFSNWRGSSHTSFQREVCRKAARYNRLELLQWLFETQDWYWGNSPLDVVLCYSGMVEKGALETLQWVVKVDRGLGVGYWESYLCESAAYFGQAEVLKWLRTPSPNHPPCPWSSYTMELASSTASLSLISWLRGFDSPTSSVPSHEPCPWDSRALQAAARLGRLDVVKWLRGIDPEGGERSSREPCPWDEGVCTAAAEGGELEVLLWLRGFNSEKKRDPEREACPWCAKTFEAATVAENQRVLEWLLSLVGGSEACPWAPGLLEIARDWKKNESVHLLLEAGYPFDS